MKKISRRDFLKFSLLPLLTIKPPKKQEDQAGHVFIPEGDGRTIQAAIDANLPNPGNRAGLTITLGRGTFEINEPLRIHNLEGLVLRGAAGSLGGTVLNCSAIPVGIEILGSHNVILEKLAVVGNGGDVLIMTARTPQGANSSQIIFRDVYAYGDYTTAAFYNVSSESNTWENVHANAQSQSLSVITVAGFNQYNIPTSIPITEGEGSYRPLIVRSGLTGQAVSSLRVFGVSAIVRDSYIANHRDHGVEMIGKGILILENVAFEGKHFAAVKLTAEDGDQDHFTLDIHSGLGANGEYGIFADDGTTVQSSRIGNTGLLPLRFDVLVFTDLSQWAAFDSRKRSIFAKQAFGCKVSLGQQDVFECANVKGVEIWDQSSLHAPRIEHIGFQE